MANTPAFQNLIGPVRAEKLRKLHKLESTQQGQLNSTQLEIGRVLAEIYGEHKCRRSLNFPTLDH